jgi:hypothetical protein
MHVLSLCTDSEHIPFYRVAADKSKTKRVTRQKASKVSGKDAKARLLDGEPRSKGKRKTVSKGGATERSKRRKTSPQVEDADTRSGESSDDELVETKSGRAGPRTVKQPVSTDGEWVSDGEQSPSSKNKKKSKKGKKGKKKKKKKDKKDKNDSKKDENKSDGEETDKKKDKNDKKKDKNKSDGEETGKKVEKGTRSTKAVSRGQPVRAARGRRASDVGADVHDWAGYSPTEVAVQKKREAALDLTPAIAKLTSVLGMWRRCEHAECRRWPRPLPQPPVQCCFCKKVRNNNPLLMLATNTVSILFPTDCHTAQMLF